MLNYRHIATTILLIVAAPLCPADVVPLIDATGPDAAVRVDRNAMTASDAQSLRRGDRISIDLGDVGPALTLTIDKIRRRAADRVTIAAADPEKPAHRAMIAVCREATLAQIWTPEQVYAIRPAADNPFTTVVTSTAWEDFGRCEEVLPDANMTPLSPALLGDCPDTGEFIDVMILFTGPAAAANGGADGILAFADLAEDSTNDSYANSNIATRLRVVKVAEVLYTETGNSSQDLNQLQGTDDGIIDGIHSMRNTVGADLVTLITTGYGNICGRAFVSVTTNGSFPHLGFNVVSDGCAIGNLTFAHELGHNQGCRHDRVNSPNPGAFDYSHGYLAPNGAFRTVMGTGGSQRIAHFSNPDVSFGGQPTGVGTAAPDSAHNALSINNTAQQVAQYRCPVPVNDDCVSAALVESDPIAISTIGAQNDGFSEPCGNFGADVWYRYVAAESGTLTISACDADFDIHLGLYDFGCPDSANESLACSDDDCLFQGAEISTQVTGPALYRIRVGGENGQTGTATLTVTLTPDTPPCPWDCTPRGGNGTVNIDDLLATIDAFGGTGPCDNSPDNGDGTFGNGVINIDDLLEVINAFGNCPE